MKPEVALSILEMLPSEDGKARGLSKEQLRRIVTDLYGTGTKE